VMIVLYMNRSPVGAETVRFAVSPPGGSTLALVNPRSTGAATLPVAVSPDGRNLAIVARNAEGRTRLWLRALDTLIPENCRVPTMAYRRSGRPTAGSSASSPTAKSKRSMCPADCKSHCAMHRNFGGDLEP
jgi:hypothetical protein